MGGLFNLKRQAINSRSSHSVKIRICTVFGSVSLIFLGITQTDYQLIIQILCKLFLWCYNLSGHSHRPSTSCWTRPSLHNGSSLGPHVLNGYGSMTLATMNTIYGKRDPALVDMWGTSYQNMKYQSSLRRRVITGGSEKAVRVSRRMGLPNYCD